MTPQAYFITFRPYGTWLHGDAKGSVDRDHNAWGTPMLPPDSRHLNQRAGLLKHPPMTLDAEHRFVVDRTLREVCAHRAWRLHALHVRTTHVHVVVTARGDPEKVMADLKAYATRRLREAGLIDESAETWSHHGSTKYLTTDDGFADAVHYVLHEQGEPLEMRCPAGWCPETNRRLRPDK